jgi:hypothetical protein
MNCGEKVAVRNYEEANGDPLRDSSLEFMTIVRSIFGAEDFNLSMPDNLDWEILSGRRLSCTLRDV